MRHHLPFGPERVAVVSLTRSGVVQAGRVITVLPGAWLFAPEKFRAEAEPLLPAP